MNICALKNVSVRLIPDVFDLSLLNHSVTEFLGFPVIDLNVNRMVGVNLVTKKSRGYYFGSFLFTFNTIDDFISLLILVSSGGPVIFKQKRLGWDGKVFVIYNSERWFLWKT